MINELLSNLYSNNSPYLSCEEKYVDNGYPHTNILYDLLQILFTNLEPTYIVECGSMLGGSAIRMAETLKKNNKSTEIICIDPFTGDVNMWDWEKNGGTGNGGWRFLRLENGIPTIYKRFLANCKYSGFENKILPINATTSVGIKLLQRLFSQNRISQLPNYIYLDSAHEKDETFIELSLCWDCLVNNGILFGDDWNWKAVTTLNFWVDWHQYLNDMKFPTYQIEQVRAEDMFRMAGLEKVYNSSNVDKKVSKDHNTRRHRSGLSWQDLYSLDPELAAKAWDLAHYFNYSYPDVDFDSLTCLDHVPTCDKINLEASPKCPPGTHPFPKDGKKIALKDLPVSTGFQGWVNDGCVEHKNEDGTFVGMNGAQKYLANA